MYRMTKLSFTASLLATLLASVMLLGAVSPTFAQDSSSGTPAATPPVDSGPVFVIHPAGGADGDFFTVEAEAGSTTDLTVVLGNADDEPMDLRTYANDTVPMANGGFAVANSDVEPTGTATWLDYSLEVTTFEPGKGIEQTFQLTVPEDAAPGQHIAGLVLETAEPLEVEGSTFFNQIIRKAIAVFIIVPGEERPAFSLDAPQVIQDRQGTTLEIPVINEGNVLVKPTGTVELTDETGSVVFSSPVQLGSVYAGTTAPVAVRLGAEIPAGTYTVSATLMDEATGVNAALNGATVALAPEDAPSVVLSMEAAVTLSPDANLPAFADVLTTITNDGEAVTNAQVLLDVVRDGEVVETFTLDPEVTVESGTTEVAERYVPPTGWEAGTWEFVVRLAIADPGTGAATTVVTVDTIPAIEVGG
jgi:hypothetical protein